MNKVSSVVKNISIGEQVELSTDIKSISGQVIVVKALEEKAVYDKLELTSGRMCKVIKDDIIVGALGSRRALEGFVGRLPKQVKKGDILHLLNLGGVIGKGVSLNLEYGRPLAVEVLGSLLIKGSAVNISQYALTPKDTLDSSAPIVLVSATGMNSGKTQVTTSLIQHLYFKGYKVCAAKVTGISLLRDTLDMYDNGAFRTLSLTDCGLSSTALLKPEKVSSAAKGILYELNNSNPDVIVVEVGDGIEGKYGVQAILSDSEIIKHVRCNVVCARSLVGAFGAQRILMEKYKIHPDIISGPVTDNSVGVDYIKQNLRCEACNAIKNGEKLAELVKASVFGRD